MIKTILTVRKNSRQGARARVRTGADVTGASCGRTCGYADSI